jgi:tRNA (mo5U34)-methyltransferase
MDIEKIKQDRKSWMSWKDIKPLKDELDRLKEYEISYTLGDVVTIEGELSKIEKDHIDSVARMMKPWRKGPFKIFDTLIESEWNSNLKYNLLKPHFNLKDKVVADVGCNNGYYMFRFLEQNPKEIIGFDPSAICKIQFDFINHFIKSDIVYELLGIEHIEFYPKKFDTIFCLGVLYHRSDPIGALKSLKRSLNKNGELFLDTFIIDGEDDIALTPKDRYSKIPNIYFIPTVSALKNWCLRAGFKDVQLLEIKTTTTDEQRKTDWIKGDSLESFLDKSDQNYTVEGYPAPKRAYIKAYL